MNTNQKLRQAAWLILLLSWLLAACGSATPTGGPQAWIDAPRAGASIPAGTSITVVSHAYSPVGVGEVLLSVDGTAYTRDAPASPGDTLVDVHQAWVATEPGLHTLQVQAFDSNGDLCGSDSISVSVTGDTTATPTEVPPPTETATATEPPATDTPTPTATPAPLEIEFWVDSADLIAGACTTLHWEVTNASLVTVNETEVAATGTWSICPESTTTYTLRAENPEGSEEREILVSVSEPDDTDAPPVPTPTVPADELVLSCRATQTLAWLPVQDPSGVAYYVKLEQQVTTTTWTSVQAWGPVSGKQVDADVECGLIYRWAVRAEDGAGNTSAWSAWSTFSIDLP